MVKRDKEIRIKLKKSDQLILKRKAEKYGMPLSKFLLLLGLISEEVSIKKSEDLNT
jgi:predicted DNA binding CopG/RHH family protein